MEPGRWARITDIYHATIARPSEERASFLGEECHGDESLRKQVETMVKAHERSHSFIESPAFAVAPELLIEEPPGDLIGRLIGHYRVESLLGVGGMGEVYLGSDERLGRKVALKLLPEHLMEDETQLSRFKTEARTASALNHPNILTVHEIGAEGNRHFIATEFIEGTTLRALLALGRMNLHDALDIVVQVASALAAAHEIGVVHRDIKPENIMLRPDGYVKVLDFGIAKLTEPDPAAADRHAGTAALPLQTRAALVMGTAQYMSPEQARGQTADARSDIWSLGVVFHEMIAGNPPFSGATPSDCIASILKTEQPPLSSALPDVPVKLQSIVHKALRKNRDERYQTIKEMLDDLRDLKAELEGSLPQIERRAESIVSKIKRHKRAAVLALAAMLAAAAVAYHFYFVTPAPLPNEKSIAVLPFENLSDDKTSSYFANGVQEEILTQLAKIGTLKVISRTSTQRYETRPHNLSEVAKQLGVANLLEGSVQKAGQKVRVHAQLIRAQDASHLWAETYDRNLDDIFSVESEVATAIAQKLQAKLTGSEQRALASKPTVNLDAYDAYLHGIDRRTESWADLLEAKRYLELAVKLDPTFALAWARLGRVEANIYFQDIDIRPARVDAARNAVETAVRLQPGLGESWLASGYYHLYCERNRTLARTAFEKARQSLPNDSDVLFALSIVDRSQGQPDNALALQAEALRLDPRNASLFFQQGETFAALRRFNEARAAADNALMITPNDRELVTFKAITYQAEGDLARAHQIIGEYSSQPWNARAYGLQLRQLMLERNYSDMIPRLRPLLAERAPSTAINQDTYYILLGMAQKLTGDLKGAQSTFAQGRDFLLETIQKSGGPQGGIHATIALMYAGAGDKPNALREANRGIELEGDDTYYAPAAEEVLAIIEAQTGEIASALGRLPKLLNAHYFSWLSFAPLTPALLRIDPVWDPLRDDPLFQKLINEGKP
jgi:non-specific serine/threonine protein kinase